MSRSKPKDPNFPGMPPIHRLHRPWIITEKINGTNGLIAIQELSTIPENPDDPAHHWPMPINFMTGGQADRDGSGIWAGSKNQWLGPDGDNFGFGAWVKENADALVQLLGPGLHRGEWWGSGIQVGYGLPKGEKRFSLFNTSRWVMEETVLDGRAHSKDATILPHHVPGLGVVPVLHPDVDGHDLNLAVVDMLSLLEVQGSQASPGFMRAEGVVAYQPSSQVTFKATIHHDDIPKALIGK